MKVVRLLLKIVGALVVLLVLAAGAVLAHGYALFSQKVNRRVPEIRVAADSAAIARGQHIAEIVCAGCHGPGGGLPLAGSDENILAIPNGPVFGILHAPNLTPGGLLGSAVSDGQLVRAIREGVGVDGRPLLVMPSAYYQKMSDEDVAALIAYLRAQPPVSKPLPARTLHPSGALILGLHQFPNSVGPAIDRPVAAAPRDSSAEHGRYLSYILACRDCHGANLRGGVKGQFPPIGPDLVTLAAAHPFEAFNQALRGGQGTGGKALDPMQMPWPTYSRLEDLEVLALYAYLKDGARP